MSGISKNKKFVNSHLLSPAANHFLEYGYYTNALPGTKSYYDYWDEEKERCLYGYTAGDITITGFHYFYLNYCRMERAVEEEQPDGSTLNRRENSFPSFYDGDHEYFHAVDQARREDKHLAVLKARRKGFSYKAASMLVRNYYFQRGSRGYVFASQKEYLIGDGLLSKAWDIMSFVDDNHDCEIVRCTSSLDTKRI